MWIGGDSKHLLKGHFSLRFSFPLRLCGQLNKGLSYNLNIKYLLSQSNQ